MTNDEEIVTASDGDGDGDGDDNDDDVPGTYCYRCGLAAGPDLDEVIVGVQGRFVCWECATDEDKKEFYS